MCVELLTRFRLSVPNQEKTPEELRILYVTLLGSYLCETIVRNLDGRWEKSKVLLGWSVIVDGEKIDVFNTALEIIRGQTGFREASIYPYVIFFKKRTRC